VQSEHHKREEANIYLLLHIIISSSDEINQRIVRQKQGRKTQAMELLHGERKISFKRNNGASKPNHNHRTEMPLGRW
jgi:hypothetical protein